MKPVLHLFILIFLLQTKYVFCYSIIIKSDSLPKREFRGVWIATVNNIDWPSKASMSTIDQKKEFIDLLTYCKNLGMNALIVQIRPSADALYHSNLEPWSHWLTGKQGVAPEPYYDPLSFMIEECHRKDMEFHAWINPFRSVQSKYMPISNEHISKRAPEWHFTYNGMQLLNPGIPEVRAYIGDVIKDIISRYPVDAIHFDDYFYPYPVVGNKINDAVAYQKYNTKGLSLGDWRRNNINEFIQQVSELIKKSGKKIKFGVSPPGIWRNKKNDIQGSDTNGLAAYDDLFADSRLWVQKGWVDYVIPQIYWNVSHKIADYLTLIDWWKANSGKAQLYIGHAAYKMESSKLKSWNDGEEINRQIAYNRHTNNILGSAFFSASSLLHNEKNFASSLQLKHYYKPALRPKNELISQVPPAPVNMRKTSTEKGWWLTWKESPFTSAGDTAKGYLLYRFPDTVSIIDQEQAEYLLAFLPNTLRDFHDTSSVDKNFNYLLTSYDYLHQESRPAYQIFEDTTTLEVNNVVVGFNIAQVDAAFQATLRTGTNKILIRNIPKAIIEQSLSILPPSGISISGIKLIPDTLQNSNLIISDSLMNYLGKRTLQLKANYHLISDSLNVLKGSEKVLLQNQALSKENVSVKSIKELDQYFFERMLEIKSSKRIMEKKLLAIREKIDFVNQQISKYTNTLDDSTKAYNYLVSIDLVSQKSGKINFEVAYQVKEANWQPTYRLAFNKYEQDLKIEYLAAVKQFTGQVWQNIPLSVSSELLYGANSNYIKGKPIVFKVAPQNISLTSTKKDKLITLGHSYPTFNYSLKVNADSAYSPDIYVDLLDATQHQWFPGKMLIFINEQLEKTIQFKPEILKDTIGLNLGEDKDIIIKKETNYDSLRNNIIFKSRKIGHTITIKNNKSKEVILQVYAKPNTELKNIKSTKFFNDANKQFDFKKQYFNWEVKIGSGKTFHIKYAYQYQRGAFSKKP